MFKSLTLCLIMSSTALFIACSSISNNGTQSNNSTKPLAEATISRTNIEVRKDFPYVANYVDVLDSKIHYVDTGGDGSVVLMIHGQPTWSYLWRNVIPELQQNHRVIALDLIGYGRSGKPDIAYTADDQRAYVNEFIRLLNLKDITLVLHDWGSYIGFSYASDYPDNVKGLAFFESILPKDESVSMTQDEANSYNGFMGFLGHFHSPGVAEDLGYEKNFFIEMFLLPALNASGSVAEAYREPFTQKQSRRPMIELLKQFPFNGKPKAVLDTIDRYGRYLAATDTPKLFLTYTPGSLVNQQHVTWARNNMKSLSLKNMGKGQHFVQESSPKELGEAINKWMTEQSL